MITGIFSKLMTDTKPQIQEVQRSRKKIKAKKTAHLEISYASWKKKPTKTKGTFGKRPEGEYLSYGEKRIKIKSDFFSGTMQVGREFCEKKKVLKEKPSNENSVSSKIIL